MVCREDVAVFKESNVKRHYETKHCAKYGERSPDNEDERKAVFNTLRTKFFGENVGKLLQKQTEGKGE